MGRPILSGLERLEGVERQRLTNEQQQQNTQHELLELARLMLSGHCGNTALATLTKT
jgi:hypothetical protein